VWHEGHAGPRPGPWQNQGVRSPLSGVRRALFVVVGLVAVALAAIGAVVPGMPTTVFLIVASYCFTRSVPWLDAHLLRGRFFAPYMRYVDGRAPMPARARATAAALLWASLSLSLVSLFASGRLGTGLAAGLVTAGLVGTVAIARVGGRAAKAGPAAAPPSTTG
jgi:uncharacterized membrane protein YbaN (DUF454 family)